MGIFDNMFGKAEIAKEDDKIPMKPVEKPVEVRYRRRVTVVWKDHTEVFDNASDFTFLTYKVFYISFKDEDGNVIKKVYVPMKEVIRFDVELIVI